MTMSNTSIEVRDGKYRKYVTDIKYQTVLFVKDSRIVHDP